MFAHLSNCARKAILKSSNLLAELAANHTGKYFDKWSSYLEIYWHLFEPICKKESDILEIGVQNGGSLEIWGKLFSNAKKIIGIDNNLKCSDLRFEDPRIKVFVEDASDPKAAKLVRETTSNLGVVIDDGSHVSSDIIRSFLMFFPELKPGGIYLVEDLHSSYWYDWEGGLSHPQSSMQFLKLLADVVNFDHWGIRANRIDLFSLIDSTKELIEERTLSEIESVQFMDSVCVIRKKPNSHYGLGSRIGKGSEAVVFEATRDTPGKISTSPPQDSNPFSRPSDLSVDWAESLRSQNQELITQRDELITQRDELTAQIQVKDESIRATENTMSWRITRPLRFLKSFATGENSGRVPPNS